MLLIANWCSMKKSATSVSFCFRRGPRSGTSASCAPFSESEYRDFLLPRKKRRSSPARVSARRRAFARVVEPNPATIFACSRSTTPMTANSRFSLRSRCCTTSPLFLLFPVMECLARGLGVLLLPFRDVALDMGAHTAAHVPGPTHEVGVIDLWLDDRRHDNLGPTIR